MPFMDLVGPQMSMNSMPLAKSTMAPIADTDSTLYPKITTHITEVVKVLQQISRDLQRPDDEVTLAPIPIVGTTKLHGTHADILLHHDDTITFQSRNVANLTSEKDNQGFAKAMSSKTKALLRLRDLYVARWKLLNPKSVIDPTHPVLIAGEWVGEKIQKDVAVSQLSKRFVMISVNINGRWQKDQDFSGISLSNHDIYNVARAGVYHATLYPDDLERTVAQVEPIAEDIATRCPFAETFGIIGAGEGLVWKCAAPHLNSDPALWFKTKGGKFKPTYARPPKKSVSFDTVEEQRKIAAVVAQIWCSEQRLEQGLDILREKSIARNLRGLGDYLKWIQNDILVEEKGYIQQQKVDEATLKIEIAKIAKSWYLSRTDE